MRHGPSRRGAARFSRSQGRRGVRNDKSEDVLLHVGPGLFGRWAARKPCVTSMVCMQQQTARKRDLFGKKKKRRQEVSWCAFPSSARKEKETGLTRSFGARGREDDAYYLQFLFGTCMKALWMCFFFFGFPGRVHRLCTGWQRLHDTEYDAESRCAYKARGAWSVS